MDIARWRSRASLAGLELVMVVGAVLAGISASRHDAPVNLEVVAGLTMLTLAFLAVESMPLHLEWSGQAYSLSLSEAPLVVGLLCWPSIWLVAARVVGGGVALAVHRKQPMHKLVFNLISQALEASLALLCFTVIPGNLSASPLTAMPAALLAVALSTGVGMLCVANAIRISVGHLDGDISRSFAATGLAGVVINPSIAVVLVSAIRLSPLAAAPILVVVLASGSVYSAYVRLRQRHANLGTLYEFTRGISSASTTELGIRDVLLRTRDMLRSERAALILKADGDESATIRWITSDGEMRTEDYVTGPVDRPLSKVLSQGTVLVLPRSSREAGHREFLNRQDARDAVLAPLKLDGSNRGVLMVQNRTGDVSTYIEDDVHMLETVATHVSTVLDNNRLVDRLRHESSHDALTGMANRAFFRARLAAALESPKARLAVVISDLNRFKEINDTLGHHHGDLLIAEVARRIAEAAPPSATVARLGGDEFALMIPNMIAPSAVELVEKIRERMEAPFVLDGISVDVDASFGIAVSPIHGKEETLLLKRADMAMYAAKSSGSGIEVYDSERDAYSPRRLALASQMRGAVEADELVLHYQPQLDREGTCVGLEALVRWEHPLYGAVGPDEFVPIAEQSGAIGPLTNWVVGNALDQLAVWRANGHDLSLSINVSMRNLLDAKVAETLAREFERTQVPAESVTLEITETHVMSDPERTLPILHRLNRLGVRLSIDDFGTGYSSLSYLRQFPVHEIKIDKSFVMGLEHQDNRAIVRAIVGVASSLGLETVAEGIENIETMQRIVELGCTRMQGFYFARPMDAGALARWLDSHDTGDPIAAVVPLQRATAKPRRSAARAKAAAEKPAPRATKRRATVAE